MLGAYQDAGVILYLLRKRKNIARIKDSLAAAQIRWGQVIKNNHYRQDTIMKLEKALK